MIRPFSLAEAAGWLEAVPSSLAGQFTGVSTDTRSLASGDLFVALRGERFDGHKFLAAAQDAGAVAAVVDRVDGTVALPQLKVVDTLVALGQLAARNRTQSDARFVAVTGSSGKTTVKEMVAAILAQAGSTLATAGNLNNHIGVPLTLLRVASEHQYAVIEHGASGVGEIAQTIQLTRPEVGIITNAGEAHLEGFGSYDNIVVAKGELIDGVEDRGVMVLNRDDPAFPIWRDRAGDRQVLSVSGRQCEDASFRHEALALQRGQQRFRVLGPGGWHCNLTLSLLGEHNVINALMAVAASFALGIPAATIAEGLASMQPVKGRLQPVELAGGITLIDDSYNANPTSMKAALGVLAGQPGLRVACLGAMAELGNESGRLHQDIGVAARTLGVDRLVAVGAGCDDYLTGFGEGAVACASHQEAVDYLLKQLKGPATVLFKGSRSSAMERVAEGFKDKVTNSCCSG
ncbi:UDP-N-acetylmuramoyl-tripeptide--D-alanyl-D-alanine ligase [Marinobacter sp. SS21]|uniref:UDP-N-acetylmuramoyl-tripeptide--D-alanyl-D- alanine ligase n=1 Tax=Marinobacter sp. SS21 TaxID=2979460 RepID=UPI00232F147C|nr:UDP-N-acetylmuramoyl-tripeptide--D-alanyl-D-alanine ligase [Marinobacter sp. SS21]MDC0664083.1 UDP-N-acetylmuramoyl-tripeptide--D-alanyl-D-alanine ligase [Marinobacter sp. SS21]